MNDELEEEPYLRVKCQVQVYNNTLLGQHVV